jgi:hypothetical protein
MASGNGNNGDLTYAPALARQGPIRALDRRERLLPAVPVSGPVVAAAGGVVAGAAAFATVRAIRNRRQLRRLRKGKRQEIRRRSLVASRSFLVDVHLLGR